MTVLVSYPLVIPAPFLAVKALNLCWCLPSHILRRSGCLSPSPAWKRWNRLRGSFRFQSFFYFLIISLGKSCDTTLADEATGDA